MDLTGSIMDGSAALACILRRVFCARAGPYGRVGCGWDVGTRHGEGTRRRDRLAGARLTCDCERKHLEFAERSSTNVKPNREQVGEP